MAALARGVEIFNQKEKRNTEICQGIFSFDQVFERDYQQATVRKASAEQLRMLMLMSEAITIKDKDEGTFELKAGDKILGRSNRYHSPKLRGGTHKKVVVRFDPASLHSKVYVYSLDGVFIDEAICIQDDAFGNTEAARTQRKLRERIRKDTQRLAKNLELLEANELAQFQPPLEEEPTLSPNIIELYIAEGTSARKVEVIEAEEEETEFEKYFQRGVSLTLKNKA